MRKSGAFLAVGIAFSLLTSSVWLEAQSTGRREEPLRRVRIATTEPEELARVLENQGFDVTNRGEQGPAIELVVSIEERLALENLGLVPIEIAIGRPFRDIQAERAVAGTVPDGYPDLDEIYAQMADAAQFFPEICQMVDLTSLYGAAATFEDRHLFALKISDQVGVHEDEPGILIVSNYHAREIVTPVIALHAIEQFLTLYGIDPQITEWVDENQIWIAPTWNPDGYNHVFTGDNLWRKNRRVFGGGTGVDLNRNYPFGWNTACAGSSSVSSQTYKGPSPASEVETLLMLAFSQDQRFAKIIDYHSFGREVLWGYACLPHPFDSYLEDQGTILSTAGGYSNTRRPSAEGEHYEWQIAEFGAMALLIETHNEFQPAFSSAQNEATQLFAGIQWLVDLPIPLTGRVTDQGTGVPLSATIESLDISFSNGEKLGSGGAFGRYYLFLPPGSYDLRFSAAGYAPQIQTVNIVANVAGELDVALQPLCFGDLTSDQMVDILDFSSLIGKLGQAGGLEDFDGDGTVTLADLNLILPTWLMGCNGGAKARLP